MDCPRLYYVSPLLVGPLPRWDRLLAHAAALGFTGVLIAPPFRPGRTGNLFDTADHAALHPLLVDAGAAPPAADTAAAFLRGLAAAAAARGLQLWVDLVLDHLAADAVLAAKHPAWFRPGPDAPDMPPDPRQPPRPRDFAWPAWEDEAAAAGLAAHFAALAARLAQAGIAGLRATAPGRVPAAVWSNLLSLARAARPGLRALVWTPGMTEAEIAPLAAAGFDLSVASTPWWDGSAPWLVAEAEARRLSLPALGLVEDPAGPRLAAALRGQDEATRRRALRRALLVATTTGAGLLMPMGFEQAATEPLDMSGGRPGDWDWTGGPDTIDLSAEVAAANTLAARHRVFGMAGAQAQVSAPGAPVAAIVRAAGGDLRTAPAAALVLINADRDRAATFRPETALPAVAGCFPRLRDSSPEPRDGLLAGRPLVLEPAELRLYLGEAEPGQTAAMAAVIPAAAAREAPSTAPRVVIEAVAPAIEGGRFAVKRTAGEVMEVEADIFGDGHEKLGACLLWRAPGDTDWTEAPLTPLGNDRWRGHFPLVGLGRHLYTVEAWRDLFATWRDEVEKKHAADLPLALELEEGRLQVERAAARSRGADAERLSDLLAALAEADEGTRLARLLDPATAALMERWAERTQAVRHPLALAVRAERRAAVFASWYEMFPRSAANDASRHGTFRDVIAHLPRIRAMGFDVLYFPPIHPIGRTHRKGRNNTLHAGPVDPGSPYAIGGAEGGHDALHPELGTLDDFRALVAAAAAHGIEIALDFAIQCSPDHPWLKAHPGWFAWRPDGSLRYAENPPKKYEDIVNVDFYAPDAVPGLWLALREVVMHWAAEGVRTFRVDNPHTKPLPFWEWLIETVQARYPDAIFLSEAFTRPKMMKRLAKLGFTQSYTYFTWRNEKRELADYLTELTATEAREYFRPHFFVNTPDINPVFLQSSGRPGFLIRAALATTLSGLWGMYCGFELCEGRALPGKEEYLDSEKYEIRAWDWRRPGNIVAEISRLNRVRRENPALQTQLGLAFLNCWNDRILAYRKMTPGRDNLVVAAVSLDPFAPQQAAFEVPLWEFGLPDDGAVAVEDLMSGARFIWRGKVQQVRLDPAGLPFALWRIAPASGG